MRLESDLKCLVENVALLTSYGAPKVNHFIFFNYIPELVLKWVLLGILDYCKRNSSWVTCARRATGGCGVGKEALVGRSGRCKGKKGGQGQRLKWLCVKFSRMGFFTNLANGGMKRGEKNWEREQKRRRREEGRRRMQNGRTPLED